MIQRLHISNYALISTIDIQFQQGLNIITGETGAGKSIILGALSLLLGGRADLRAIRDASKKSIIEAYFDTKGFALLRPIFTENDIDWDDDTCILRRELSPSGRSRAFINDTPVNLQLLHDVAIQLVDIHSQHQNLLLANHDYQLSVIDSLAENKHLLERYAEAYHAYRAALKRYTDTRDMITRNQADAEFISFQLDQLNEMKLQPGEQEELERERDKLANMTQIKEYLSDANEALSGRESNVLAGLAEAADSLQRLSDVLDDADSLAERLESARLEIKDIAETIADYNSDMNADPQLLDDIETRLGRIYSLETKHHVETSDDLIALRDKLAAQLAAIDNADESLAVLQEEAKTAKKAASAIARQLSERRHAQASVFAEELRERAMPLGMKNLRCEVTFSPTKLSPTGIDQVDFKFAFNKNQPLMSVGATASGGEISRLILSIKLVIAEKMQLPTIIFDEVDTGVSGDVAVRMGALMAHISLTAQVIAITHLPQVAAKGSAHYKVYKEDDETSTNTRIRLLTQEERVGELALMLSGTPNDPSARAAAQTLLNSNS
ncbi:MAG: DNA repair protein RecN [Bacteroidales bacterium]|nr:DNA repair protein RecN [Bacteroidales bacterium]